MVAKSETQDPIFYLPDLGEGLEEAELIEWNVRVGQRVEENDTLAKMETAKALVDVPSPRSGVGRGRGSARVDRSGAIAGPACCRTAPAPGGHPGPRWES